MKKIFTLLFVFGFFAISSCKKSEGLLSSNATFIFHKVVCNAVCCSGYEFQIDNVPNIPYKSTGVPEGFQIPDQETYTVRVYIEYKPYNHPGGCENFIEITKIRKIE